MVLILKNFILLSIITLVICSCGTNNISVSDTADPLKTLQIVNTQYSDILFPGTTVLSDIDPSSAEKIELYQAALYFGSGTEDIDMTKIDCYAILSAAPASASQFGILKAKTKRDVDTVERWVKERFIRVESDFSSYLPYEENIAKNAVVKTSGCYVWYVACADNESVLGVIEETLKKQ